jgi:hypothetical protein
LRGVSQSVARVERSETRGSLHEAPDFASLHPGYELRRHCERSEAIRTRHTCKMDCFVASFLATTSGTPPRSRRAFSREFGWNVCPRKSEGAGNAGRLMRPQPRVQSRKHTSSHHGHTGITRHSPRNGFTACFVLSPVTGLVCHRRRRSCSTALTPASGRQDHTTSPSALAPFVKGAAASTASRPASVTIASAPLRDGMAKDILLICPTG